MFDLGWTEFIVVAVVAILVVGPKELPGMLRTIGKTIGNLRRMAGDFQRQMNDALKEADLDGIKTGIDSVNSINPVSQIKGSLNPIKQAAEDVQRDINKGLLKPGEGAKSDTPAKADTETASSKPKSVTQSKSASKPKTTTKSKAAAKPRATAKTATTAKSKSRANSTAAKTTRAKTAASKSTAAKPTAARKPAAKKSTAKTAGTAKKETDA